MPRLHALQCQPVIARNEVREMVMPSSVHPSNVFFSKSKRVDMMKLSWAKIKDSVIHVKLSSAGLQNIG